jgi:hypothetical protein
MAPPPPRKRSHNYFNTGGASFRRRAMLNMGQAKLFRYSLRDLFHRHEVDPKVADPLQSMIIAKGSRSSIDEAKDFVDEKVKEGVIKGEVADDIFNLLDRFITWR